MDTDTFFTWGFLTTLGGCALGTGVLTQFTKALCPKLPTQVLSFLIALALLLLATLFTSKLTLSNGLILPLNAVLASLTSNGGYAAIQRARAYQLERKSK